MPECETDAFRDELPPQGDFTFHLNILRSFNLGEFRVQINH